MPDAVGQDLGTPFLRFERQGHLAWLTIDRPASRNALSAAMYFGVKRAVQLVNALPEPAALYQAQLFELPMVRELERIALEQPVIEREESALTQPR